MNRHIKVDANIARRSKNDVLLQFDGFQLANDATDLRLHVSQPQDRRAHGAHDPSLVPPMAATFNETERPDFRVKRTQRPNISGSVVTSMEACEPCEGVWLAGTAKAGKGQRRDIATTLSVGRRHEIRSRSDRAYAPRNAVPKVCICVCHSWLPCWSRTIHTHEKASGERPRQPVNTCGYWDFSDFANVRVCVD